MTNALLIHPEDNVAVVTSPIRPGESVWFQGPDGEVCITAREEIPIYHKIAIQDIGCGDMVVKYAHPIGVAMAPIAQGTLVHCHNVKSPREGVQA